LLIFVTLQQKGRLWPVFGPPTDCGMGYFWPAWYLQMRRPEYSGSQPFETWGPLTNFYLSVTDHH